MGLLVAKPSQRQCKSISYLRASLQACSCLLCATKSPRVLFCCGVFISTRLTAPPTGTGCIQQQHFVLLGLARWQGTIHAGKHTRKHVSKGTTSSSSTIDPGAKHGTSSSISGACSRCWMLVLLYLSHVHSCARTLQTPQRQHQHCSSACLCCVTAASVHCMLSLHAVTLFPCFTASKTSSTHHCHQVPA